MPSFYNPATIRWHTMSFRGKIISWRRLWESQNKEKNTFFCLSSSNLHHCQGIFSFLFWVRIKKHVEFIPRLCVEKKMEHFNFSKVVLVMTSLILSVTFLWCKKLIKLFNILLWNQQMIKFNDYKFFVQDF